MRLHRIMALVYRHLCLYRRSAARLMEVFYWPLLDLLVWGFLTVYLEQVRTTLPAVAFLLGAMILWDILYRSQQGISMSFLEEIWSRNLLNLFVTPLRAGEFLLATILISVGKVVASAAVTVLLAWLLYSFNLFVLGVALIPFVLSLVALGWAIGIATTAMVLRYGQKAEVTAWALAFLIQPIAAVFYPVSVLPAWLQPLAYLIPATHVFEGMRAVILTGAFPGRLLLQAVLLNLLHLGLALAFFYRMLRVVREKGLLVRIGE